MINRSTTDYFTIDKMQTYDGHAKCNKIQPLEHNIRGEIRERRREYENINMWY